MLPVQALFKSQISNVEKAKLWLKEHGQLLEQEI